MYQIQGRYASATIYNSNPTQIDPVAINQIQFLCDHPSFDGCIIKVMPDVHPGRLSTIGFTSTLGTSIIPYVIGIDIGCGVTVAEIKGRFNEYEKLDKVIRECVPSGCAVHKKKLENGLKYDFTKLLCAKHINNDLTYKSLGTLGGGNHFIELDQDEEKNRYLIVHSGSRHLGKEVTEFYMKEGQKVLKQKGILVPYELTYLDGKLMEDYLHDLQVVQEYAELNRQRIVSAICKHMKWKIQTEYSCIHNYIDFSSEAPMIRKGAISAKKDEKVVIPINMRDGVILGVGKGNKDWNESAPHGAGRIGSRESIRSQFTVSQFKKEMNGIYSSCIGPDTLDEAPFAYRAMEEIKNIVQDTIAIQKILKPVYNFKAGDNERK